MIRFDTIICAIFLSGQLNFGITEAPPESLTVQIRNDHQNIVLNWKRTDQYMANTNLPIWRAWRNRAPELIPNLMEEIGPFTMYHDTEMSSAIILFQYPQRIYGVIDTRFYIKALPLSEVGPNIHHVVGGPYVDRRSYKYFHDQFYDFPDITATDIAYVDSFLHDLLPSQPQGPYDSPSLPNLNENDINSVLNPQLDSCYETRPLHGSSSLPNLDANRRYDDTNPQPGPSHAHQVGHTHQVGDTLYAEVLVFISNDVLRHFIKKDPDLKLLVAYYLIHFNAIDMLFAKLAEEIKIHINIAGLVLESERIVFPLVFLPGEQPLHILDGDQTLNRFPSYIKKYNDIFVQDSFDFYYVSTHYTIAYENNICEGLSIAVSSYDNRRNSKGKYRASGILVQRKPIHTDYIDSAHEIAHQMDVNHDPEGRGNLCDGQQCYAILQESGTYCRNCIRWSDESKAEFKTYVSTNVERCFLLNPPRSLHPYGTPITTIGPNRQCTCYRYQSHWSGSHLDEVLGHRCNAKIACAYKNRPVHHALPKPIDGTPCGAHKVCWREQCQTLGMPPFVQPMD